MAPLSRKAFARPHGKVPGTATTMTDASATHTQHTDPQRTSSTRTIPVENPEPEAGPSQAFSRREIRASVTEDTPYPGPVHNLRDLRCIRTLGTGSWGAVYLVHVDKRHGLSTNNSGALLALKRVEKRMYRDSERNDDRSDRWEATEYKHIERRALSALPWNPFIVGLLDVYTDPRNVYYLLELAPRGSIHDYLAEYETMPHNVARFYFSNIVLGIEFLHTHGLVHKDIKTENILIGEDGYAMLTDFGLSQYADGTHSWDLGGTFLFWSPEVLAADTDSREPRLATDWWAAACCLFEMAAGKVPFMFQSPPEATRKMKFQLLCEEHNKRNIRWPDDMTGWEDLRNLLEGMFEPCLADRLGVKTVEGYDGSVINQELRQHAWFSTLSWNKVKARTERVPLVLPVDPFFEPSLGVAELPAQKKAPGLRLKRRRRPQFDAEGNLIPDDRNGKRRRVDLDSAPSSMAVELGSA